MLIYFTTLIYISQHRIYRDKEKAHPSLKLNTHRYVQFSSAGRIPNITTRGFVLVNENEELLRKIENMAGNLITKKLNDSHVSFSDLKTTISQDLSSYVYELTGRRPLLLPIILDVKKEVKEKI